MRLFVLTIVLLSSAMAGAAQPYPSKPLRFIVPFAPGGGNDIIARVIGQKLSERWGTQVVVDNRPGAGGNVAAEITAKAAPDIVPLVIGILHPPPARRRPDTGLREIEAIVSQRHRHPLRNEADRPWSRVKPARFPTTLTKYSISVPHHAPARNRALAGDGVS